MELKLETSDSSWAGYETNFLNSGSEMISLMQLLWPIARSITGDGVRETLSILNLELHDLRVCEVESGREVFDWKIPQEWRVKSAYIIDPAGRRFCDFSINNLHLVGYSTPFRGKLSLGELQSHLYSLPNQPNAIPYVTSYYERKWGFCLSEIERNSLIEGQYEVVVDTELFDGSLTYAELLLPGISSKEIMFSTYVCHPSMANNELSGPVVTTFLIKWLKQQKIRKFSYRFIFAPETIGAIAYLQDNLQDLKRLVVAGYNVTCVGDERQVGFLPSRQGNTLSDKVAETLLNELYPDFIKYSWEDRGSDERQYCAPGINLPIASIFRTKYGEFPEYHTSLDTIGAVVTERGLNESLDIYKKLIYCLENNEYLESKILCEPHLSKRSLYPTTSIKGKDSRTSDLMNVLSYCDGEKDLIDISNILGISLFDIIKISKLLIKSDLVSCL